MTVTARWLGPDGRGIIAAITTWVGLFSAAGHLSLGQVAIHRATKLRGQAWLERTLGSLVFLDIAITVMGWIITIILYFSTQGRLFSGFSPNLLTVGFLILPLLIWEQYGSALLMAADQISIYNRALVVGRTTGLILVLLSWVLDVGIVGVLIATLISQSVVAMSGMHYLVRQTSGRLRPDWATIIELIKGGIRLHPNYVGGFIITSSSILIINHYRGASETGYYQLAQQLIGILLIIPQSASMVVFSKVTQLGPNAAWQFQRKIVLLLTCGLLGLSVLASVIVPFIVPIFLGDKFLPSLSLFQTLLWVVPGMTLVSAMSSQWIGRGLFAQMSALTIILATINLVADFVLVPTYGAYGAAWSMIGIYALGLVVQFGMILWCELQYRGISPTAQTV